MDVPAVTIRLCLGLVAFKSVHSHQDRSRMCSQTLCIIATYFTVDFYAYMFTYLMYSKVTKCG